MKGFITLLVAFTSSEYVPGVPSKNGPFFYLELDKGSPSDDVILDEY